MVITHYSGKGVHACIIGEYSTDVEMSGYTNLLLMLFLVPLSQALHLLSDDRDLLLLARDRTALRR